MGDLIVRTCVTYKHPKNTFRSASDFKGTLGTIAIYSSSVTATNMKISVHV